MGYIGVMELLATDPNLWSQHFLPGTSKYLCVWKALPTVFDSIVGPVGPWAILSRGKDPCATVDEIAALGLRHVGYAVPIELFEPFVEGQLVDLWRW